MIGKTILHYEIIEQPCLAAGKIGEPAYALASAGRGGLVRRFIRGNFRLVGSGGPVRRSHFLCLFFGESL